MGFKPCGCPKVLSCDCEAVSCEAVGTECGGIKGTLQQRGARYGKFSGHAVISQHLKVVMSCGNSWNNLTADQREALEMIAHKIARILNGNPNYHDSWHDIAGYATLVADELEEKQQPPEATRDSPKRVNNPGPLPPVIKEARQ